MKKLLKFLSGGKTLPTAPPAEQRYKGGTRTHRVLSPSIPLNDSTTVDAVKAKKPWFGALLGYILRAIDHSAINPAYNDTTYMEVPTANNPFVKLQTRGIRKLTPIGGNHYYQIPYYFFGIFSGNGKSRSAEDALEFLTMKKRFNTAWNVSSKQDGGTIDEPSGKFNNALFNLGIGAADSGLFASMLHKDGGVLKGQKGLEAKSDNTRVSKIPNNGEAIYRNPEDENWALDFVPILGTIRAAERYDHNGHPGDLVDAGISGAMDLLGAGMIGSVVKAAGKANRIHKALKSRGFTQITKEPTHWARTPKYVTTGLGNKLYSWQVPFTETAVKVIPNVDYYNVAMQPMIQSLRVPFEAPFKYSAYLK